MRMELAYAHCKALNHGVYDPDNDCMNIDIFCERLVQEIRATETAHNRNANWEDVSTFVERFAVIPNDEINSIALKHWKSNVRAVLSAAEFKRVLLASVHEEIDYNEDNDDNDDDDDINMFTMQNMQEQAPENDGNCAINVLACPAARRRRDVIRRG
mmetsp:Transcript_40534/g.66584  ORF Transcript_40534/g.66584 Transcript_40534/m.66584 type:complete len:157 (-) Transcript_40534:76-546(-)